MTHYTATATPTKLKNGSWGARVASTYVRAGDIVRITTRGGKSWDAEITKVVWSGNGVSICATRSDGERCDAEITMGVWSGNIVSRCDSRRFGCGSAARRERRKTSPTTGCRCGRVVEYSKPTDCWR